MGSKKDFRVNITRLTKAVAQKGFGTILILSNEKASELKEYTDMTEVVVDFEETTDTYKMAGDIFGQNIAKVIITGIVGGLPEGLTARLDETVNDNVEFFGLVCTDNTPGIIEALSAWADTNGKVYAVTTDIKTTSNKSNQTLIAYHTTDNLGEKCLAYMLVREIGSVDLDGKAIPNITASGVDSTELGVLKGNNINVCIERFGVLVIEGGDMAGGERVDVILSEFWIKIRMEEDLAQLKISTPKIPYTDQGVALLIGVANTRLQMATKRGIIALNENEVPEYEVTYVPVSEVADADRANRVYDYVKWTARLSGSIRSGVIYGELTI